MYTRRLAQTSGRHDVDAQRLHFGRIQFELTRQTYQSAPHSQHKTGRTDKYILADT